ncbi:sigma-E processing peptidase SpoIIGA [Paenibacillus turicensis]|uniref:sigma-E processing peptidase SpoIIGA n=1 Tax=Paenibacillus turicensis TaxID=160487 RepID=UPI0031591E9E
MIGLIVYIDLIFFVNLLIDASLLLTTAWLRKLSFKWWRIIFSASIGAMYVLMMFLPALSFMFTFLVKFLFSVVMLWTAFGFPSLQAYSRNLGAFYIVNFVAAGGILGFHYMLQDAGEVWNGIWYMASGGMTFTLSISMVFILVSFGIVLFWFRSMMNNRKNVERVAASLAEVEVQIEGIKVACIGLIDTGNQLTDPLSRLPVMVMEANMWSDFLPDSWKGKLGGEHADNLIMEWMEVESFSWRDRLRLVPYRGFNRGTQFMIAIKPDQCVIQVGEQQIVSTKVLIGLDGGTLSSEGKYQAIIHPSLTEVEVTDH